MLSSASRRLCVLSYANSSADKACNKEGELRLYGSTYSDLYAVIRLSLVTKVMQLTNNCLLLLNHLANNIMHVLCAVFVF